LVFTLRASLRLFKFAADEFVRRQKKVTKDQSARANLDASGARSASTKDGASHQATRLAL